MRRFLRENGLSVTVLTAFPEDVPLLVEVGGDPDVV